MKSPNLLIVTVLAATPVAAVSVEPGYRVVQSVPIADGSLQVLEDARLTPALARELWDTAVDPIIALGEDSPAAKPFKTKPLRPARLRQVTSNGAIAVDVVPDEQAPIARIDDRRLGAGPGAVFMITTDNYAGFGSYSGLATALYVMSDGRLKPLMATKGNGKTEAVVLASTLKSGWKIVGAQPNGAVIQQVRCRPDFSQSEADHDQRFLVTYETYWPSGDQWRVAKRVTVDFWEADDDWPAPSEFPKPGT